ncbi:MAG: hypothetical protein JST52_02370 [Bacteroidetes bacterium]|nr:hypothetical protein [Bacteroidota bacterium]MBS1739806.1 hypothetical protein [Bacteroidota bacterium]
MKQYLTIQAFLFIFSFCSHAQDLSNKGLMSIIDQSDAQRVNWMKLFDEAIAAKSLTALNPTRIQYESFLDKNLSSIRRLYAEGDGRALLTAVSNYLQIERQFVKDVMAPAESISPANQEDVDKVYKKINDFGQKEKSFLIDINNALATEGMEEGNPAAVSKEQELNADDAYEDSKGSIIEERQQKRRGKLPHEQSKRKSNKTENEEE